MKHIKTKQNRREWRNRRTDSWNDFSNRNEPGISEQSEKPNLFEIRKQPVSHFNSKADAITETIAFTIITVGLAVYIHL